MRYQFSIFAFLLTLAALLPLPAHADTITLRDGTVRRGTIVQSNRGEIVLRVDNNGIRATLHIPTADILDISKTPLEPALTPTPPTPATQPQPIPAPTPQPHRNSAFLKEFLRTLIANGPDDPRRLPKDLQDLWQQTLNAENENNKPKLLSLQLALHDATQKELGASAPNSLNAISLNLHNTRFDTWLADTRWQIISTKYRNGQFDLSDLRDIEKKPLIATLRLNTDKSLEPLRPYFPPLKDGTSVPFHPSQLAGITVQNALDLKEKSLYASAILLAQLKLEPQMPFVDRNLLSTQLTSVRRILARTLELESRARSLQQKQARDQKLAEERAQKEANRTRTASPPR